jgi:Tlde1 domain
VQSRGLRLAKRLRWDGALSRGAAARLTYAAIVGLTAGLAIGLTGGLPATSASAPKSFAASTSVGSPALDLRGVRIASLAPDIALASLIEDTDARRGSAASPAGRSSFRESVIPAERGPSFEEHWKTASLRVDSEGGLPFDAHWNASDLAAGLRTADLEERAKPEINARARAAARPVPAKSAPAAADVSKNPVRVAEAAVESSSAPEVDDHTAIYDIAAHMVYLPDGTRLEAHSGLGSLLDDPRYVNVKDRGATPPNVYDLSLREESFHGVRAIRLNPVDDHKMFGRDGILAHPYMMGSNGQSNGCVSVSDYEAFLNAYLSGDVNRLVVVEHLAGAPAARTASSWIPRSIRALIRPLLSPT